MSAALDEAAVAALEKSLAKSHAEMTRGVEVDLQQHSSLLLRGFAGKMRAPIGVARCWEAEAKTYLRSEAARAAIAAEGL